MIKFMFLNFYCWERRICKIKWYLQGFHSHWKTWKNERSFSSQGILEFHQKVGEFSVSQGKVREN